MVDLAEIQKDYDEFNLGKAIENNDRAAMAEYLRKLSENLSPELVNKLADYLDPAIENPLYKCGPKPKKTRSWMFGDQVISFYYWLWENRQLARCILNQENEAFFLIDNSALLDSDGNFSPQWEYPHAERKRELVPLPKKEEIKDYICKIFHINRRVFDDLRKEYNKRK